MLKCNAGRSTEADPRRQLWRTTIADSVESECGLFADYVDPFASGSRRPAACRARAERGRGAASPPAPSRRLLARPRPATHSWAHPLPYPTPPVRVAPAARSRLPSPGRTRPRRGEPTSPVQEADGSSEASDALCDVSTSHATARRCPAAPGRAAACRPPAARGEERNRCTAPSTPQNGNRSPWLCCLYL